MTTQATTRSARLLHAGLLLLLVAAIVLAGCSSEVKPKPEPMAATALPASDSGQVIVLPVGGSLVVPDGALPPDAQVSASVTQMPLLPDGVEGVGEALAISATAQPTEPILVRLPVPAGVANPADLVIVRVEANGATTFLMSDVDGNEVVATTLGFSTFLTAPVLELAGVDLIGDAQLRQGEQTVYYIDRPISKEEGVSIVPRLTGTRWRIVGSKATLVRTSDNAAIVQAGDRSGFEILCSETLDYAYGRRWLGCKTLYIEGGGADGAPKLTVNTLTPMVASGEPLRITAGVYGAFQPPITWEWDFGDGTMGRLAESNETRIELPSKNYSPQDLPKRYPVTVKATDHQGVVTMGGLDIRVVSVPFSVAIEGPQVLTWQDGGVAAQYTARAAGGELPYEYRWKLPGVKLFELAYDIWSERVFTFPEPGDYRLEVGARDFASKETTALLPIRAEGGEALSTRLLDLPATAKPDAEVAVNIQVRGGVLIVSGKKAGYTLQVDWGDGSQPSWQENVGADVTSQQGTAVPVAHIYTQPRTYTVRITAFDPTGSMAIDTREISVTEAEAATPPPVAEPNTPPTAEHISTSTRAGDPVMITLAGSDADGDTLTYTVIQSPASGTLSGAAPFLTYTPAPGFGGTDTFTFKVNDGQADSPPATVSVLVESLRWVREREPLINATEPKAPLEYYGGGSTPGYFTEDRFAGKFTIYRLSETHIAMDDREVDHGKEYWNVTIESRFDAPPPVLSPGQVATLTVQFSGSGSITEGTPPGVVFQYGADGNHRGIIQPADTLSFGFADFEGSYGSPDTKSWTLTVPQGRPGDTFQVWAGWWNCAMCNVTWTYRAE